MKSFRIFLIIAWMLTYCYSFAQESGNEINKGKSQIAAQSQLSEKVIEKRTKLKSGLESVLSAKDFDNALWGAYVIKDNEEILFNQLGNKWFIPASNMKIYSTSAVIDILGKDYRYITKLEAVGEITKDGVLKGDLVITGSGDPSFCSRQVPNELNNYKSIFKLWKESLLNKGIKKVDGNIIGDGRIFGDQYYSNGAEVDDLFFYYSAGSSGLAIEENTFRYTFAPGKKIGDKIQVTCYPDTKYLTYKNDAVTTAAKANSDADIIWRGSDNNNVTFGGYVALDKNPYEQSGAVWDSSKYAAFLMKEYLESEGFAVTGNAMNITSLPNTDYIDKPEPGKKILVTQHESLPLSDLVRICNKISYNFYADMFARTVGYKVKGVGTYENGRDAIREWLKKNGIPEGELINMVDGSGLSRRDGVQPRQSVYLLKYMLQQSAASDAFLNSLAIMGVDGDISYRLKGTRAEGNLKAKSGYINNVRSLSGYVKDADGETLIFSFMVNHARVDMYRMDAIIDQACKILADYSEK